MENSQTYRRFYQIHIFSLWFILASEASAEESVADDDDDDDDGNDDEEADEEFLADDLPKSIKYDRLL